MPVGVQLSFAYQTSSLPFLIYHRVFSGYVVTGIKERRGDNTQTLGKMERSAFVFGGVIALGLAMGGIITATDALKYQDEVNRYTLQIGGNPSESEVITRASAANAAEHYHDSVSWTIGLLSSFMFILLIFLTVWYTNVWWHVDNNSADVRRISRQVLMLNGRVYPRPEGSPPKVCSTGACAARPVSAGGGCA